MNKVAQEPKLNFQDLQNMAYNVACDIMRAEKNKDVNPEYRKALSDLLISLDNVKKFH
jgi:hypothetical protein